MSTKFGNLMLNLSAGMLPESLTPTEIGLLEDEYGDNWFEILGYREPEYKKPSRNIVVSVEQVLEANGFIIECESPFELYHEETNSRASGYCAKLIVESLK